MIVSDLESLFVHFLAGGILASVEEGRLSEESARAIDEFLALCAAPGTTAAAREELEDAPSPSNP